MTAKVQPSRRILQPVNYEMVVIFSGGRGCGWEQTGWRFESGAERAHSKTLRDFEGKFEFRQVLECARFAPLYGRVTVRKITPLRDSPVFLPRAELAGASGLFAVA